LRAAATGVGLTLALSVALPPAHPQDRDAPRPQTSGEPLAKAPQSPSSSWVRICEAGQLKGKDQYGSDAVKDVETCMTQTEQIHPDTGMTMLGVTFQQMKLDGGEKHVLTITVPNGVTMAAGAAVSVLPADLWQKVKRKEKLDRADESRLKARTLRLSFKQCLETGCVAEAEAAPLFIDLLKENAGLVVHTLRPPGARPVFQLVALDGFAQALVGPPTDSRKFKAAREQLMKQIEERRKAKR
jgi:invasion protein IalB